MITLEQLPLLARIAAKIDLSAMGAVLRRKDLLPDGINKDDISTEQMMMIAFEVGAVIVPKMEDISKDITELVAVKKGITVAEAGKLDAIQSIKDLLSEAGVLDFFIKRLKLATEPQA